MKFKPDLLLTALLVIFTTVIICDIESKKCEDWCPETKPSPEELQRCARCRSRADCKKQEVCCNFGSGCYCILPKPKAGKCPSTQTDINCFRNVCMTDYDCKGKKKCCGNGCICADPA